MPHRIDPLTTRIGDDGASTTDEVLGISEVAEIPLLMDAWCRERQHRIEFALLLRRVRRLLARIEAEGSLTSRRSRQVRELIELIEEMDLADRHDEF